MKTDLDQLMQERGFDALVVMGQAAGNHMMRYITNNAVISHGHVLKKRGEAPVILCRAMERDEAAKSGLEIKTDFDLGYTTFLKETGSRTEATLLTLVRAFELYDVNGTVSFYGLSDPGQAYVMLKRLAELCPDMTITGELEHSVFEAAYETKSDEELEFIKDAALRTNTVYSETIEFIQQHKVKDNHLVQAGGEPLRIGDVRQFINRQLMAHELELEGETIFALGRDGAVPHSRGEDSDVLELGKTIVFDLFPRSKTSGYFHDMTRTFCLGYATSELEELYAHVQQAFEEVISQLKVGEPTSKYQDLTCDIFEEHGHPTPRSHPGTIEGYVHSLGHGISLEIHSSPYFGKTAHDTVKIGQVFTIEPGLYYPDRDCGFRIEDTLYVDQNGEFQNLTTFSKEFVIPVGD